VIVPLSALADVSLGFKSLQNNFYYVNQATIDTYGIEKRFLVPVLMRKALDPRAYKQDPVADQWLFNCRDKKEDLRGTGALKYIEAMADRSAAEKKQSGKKGQTIRDVLTAQGGGFWYAPKARPNKHHVWLRKAFDGTFAPYLFEAPALVDQRFNSLSPLKGIDWQELAAIVTSTLFAYSLEINGSASMGAGALEAPTTKLREYPVPDIRKMSAGDRKKLVSLGAAVWMKEPPVDWSETGSTPGKALRALDVWLLQKTARPVTVETLYADLSAATLSRLLLRTKRRKRRSVKPTASAAWLNP
jgi:hypothetical protein